MAMIAAVGAGKVGAAQGQKPQGHGAEPAQNFGNLLKQLLDMQGAAQVNKSHDSTAPTPPTAASTGISIRA